MTMASGSEWDDIPSSSEFFGGDFFGDALMEMYSAIGESPATSAAAAVAAPLAADSEDEKSHPGLLIAMNAAAMDGGLSPLGSSPDEFIPMTAASNADAADLAALPPYYSTTPEAVHVEIEEAAALAPLPASLPFLAAVTSAPAASAPPAVVVTKRPVAAVTDFAQGPSKKRKGGGAAPLPATVPQAKVAATGGVMVSCPPGVVGSTGAPATRPIGGAVSPSSVYQGVKAPAAAAISATGVRYHSPNNAALPKKIPAAVTAAPGVKSTVIPKMKMPVGGGINHQVIARPSMVPSSSAGAAHRIMPPAPSLSAAVRAAGIIGGRKCDSPLSVSSTGVIRAKSEADFKDVASAAVSSLIQNASGVKTGPKPPSIPKSGDMTVDVSTAHINALTSQNWVTACNPIPIPEVSTSCNSASACDKAARNARRATLTQEERAKQNRDRNREHARNTRLRKKAYVEELKRTLTELVAQRDAADLEKRHEAQRNREQREVRFRVMEEFLKLRGRNELNAARWVAILEDGFTFTLPRTTFRRMVDGEKFLMNDVNGVTNSSRFSMEQVLRGAAAVMEDSQHLSTFLRSVGGAATSASRVEIAYRCDRKRFFMDGNIAFMDFNANTIGAVAKGALNEATFKGSIRASFSPASNKLISMDVEFDTAAFVQQVESMGDVSSAAAAVAAHEADALLDSLQMPQIYVDKKDVVTDGTGPVSVSSDDGERSIDGITAFLNA